MINTNKFYSLSLRSLLCLATLVVGLKPAYAEDSGYLGDLPRPSPTGIDYQAAASNLGDRIVKTALGPRAFIPFTLSEVCKVAGANGCSSLYAADEWVDIKKEELDALGQKQVKVLFQGTATQYLAFLNDKEKYLTAQGHSMRDQAEEFLTQTLPTDVLQLREQLLAELRIKGAEILDQLRPAIPADQCPMIPELDLSSFSAGGIEVGAVKPLPIQDVVKKLNESQRILCALGFNAFEGLDFSFVSDPKALLGQALQARDALLSKLGLSSFLSAFQLGDFKDLSTYLDVAKDIEKIVTGKEFPGPEQLQATLNKLDIRLPELENIPNIPNIPSPVAPKRMDLKLKKRKDWPGFNFGNKSLLAAEANAFLEINGSDKQQEVRAQGKASGYIFNNEINVVGGYGYFYIGPDQVKTEVVLRALGRDVFKPIRAEGGVKWVKEDPKAFTWRFDEGFSQQFAIGPIPVYVKVGVFAGIGLGYKIGLETTQLIAEVRPYASAGGYAQAGAGIAGFLSVGAGADIVVLELSVPLSGRAGLRFDEVGYPFIALAINADVNLEYLSGRVYAFVEFPVPAFALPPWEIKKETFTIHAFRGEQVSHKIMNWGLELGRFGAKSSGDLVDSTDREEAQQLEQAILVDVRALEIGKYEQEVFRKTRETFEGILNDFRSDANAAPYRKLEETKLIQQQLEDNAAAFAENLRSLGGN